MSQIDVSINGRKYKISCDDGQEDHLVQLGAMVDKRVSELVAGVGQIGDNRLLVMASLLLADDLAEAQARLQTGDPGGAEAARAMAIEVEERAAQAIDQLAQRIEVIAEGLEAS